MITSFRLPEVVVEIQSELYLNMASGELYLNMASEIVDGGSVQLESFVRGHHVYQILVSWTPNFGEVLLVKIELTNEYDRFAVAVLKDGEVVGHVPQALSKAIFFSLRYDGNVAFCEVTGERLNRGVQLGVEVPCAYKCCAVRLVQIN